jgi:excinuclease UvrABC ATPase subunit
MAALIKHPADSHDLINETYSAFVQGFMPTLARPEVDVLDGLTTAIIVDHNSFMSPRCRPAVGSPSSAAQARRRPNM